MSDTTNTAESGAGAVAPATNDAPQQVTQGTEQQTELTPEQQEAAKAEQQRQEEEGRKKNRTREYIERIKQENAELRRRVAEQEFRSQPRTQQQASPTPQQQADRRPALEDYGYDFNAWQQADTQWIDKQAERRVAELLDQRTQQQRQQETWSGWAQRSADFAAEHDDFEMVVGSMPGFDPALQEAIARHPNGPAIAYHLGNNPADLLAYANTNPHYADLALQTIAARLGSAPAAPQQPAAPAAPAPNKPITKAPPPAPTVGGRAPASVDPDRMTTEQWREWREAQLKAKKG
jgi:hypothetical protein